VPFVRHIENTGIRIYFNAFDAARMAKGEFINELDLGAHCFSIGFPAAYWDRKTLLPVAKASRLASIPSVDYGTRHQLLLDTQCSPGWLGAPVLLEESGQMQLMGMLCSANPGFDRQDSDEPLPNDSSMSIMIRNEAISETIAAYLKEKGFI
jgi:hypothetical protein